MFEAKQLTGWEFSPTNQKTEKGTDQWAARQSSGNHCHQREKKEKNIGQFKKNWDNIKHIDIHIIGFPEEETEWGIKYIWRYKAETFYNLGKKIIKSREVIESPI